MTHSDSVGARTSRRRSKRREHPFVDQGLAQSDPVPEIYPQDRNSRSACLGLSKEHRSPPPEVPVPIVATRMEKPNDASGSRINTGQVRSFPIVACEAGLCQIIRAGSAAVYFGKNVVDLEGALVGLLGEQAILAGGAGALPNSALERSFHAQFVARPSLSALRAFDFNMASKCPARS